MSSISTENTMSDIEKAKLAKKLEQNEKKKAYMREYSKNRRLNDPEYRLKRNEATRINNKTKYETNEEYRNHHIDSCRNRYMKYKEAYIKSLETSED